jgi:tRNA threonylcarbamoyladenosine biosynthesis protein TsaE
MEFTFTSHCFQDTIAFGRLLGSVLKKGDTLGITGDLGSGKTCFIKGIANGLNNIPENDVTSPTFTILQEYDGALFPLYHFDVYRLSGVDDLETIGFHDYIRGDGVAVIEWADKIYEALPEERLMVSIDFLSEDERRFTCVATGEESIELLEKFQALCGQVT